MNDARNAIHIGLTAIMVWLALYFALCPSLFVIDGDFAYMASFASQHSWAVIFAVVANIGVLGLVSGNTAIRLTSVLVVATAHGIIALCLILSAANIWSGTYAVVAAMGYYLAFRNARIGL